MQKNLTSLSVGSLFLWTLVAAIAGCSPSEEELRAKKALEDQKFAEAYAIQVQEEQLRLVKSIQVLVKLSDKQLYKLLDDCQQQIREFAAQVFDGKSIGAPEVITEHSSAVSQAEAYMASKSRLVSDTTRIKEFRAISKADLASGSKTLDTFYPVLIKEDSFSGLQPRVMKYQCQIVDGQKIEVTP